MTAPDAPVADWVSIAELNRDPFPIYQRLRAEGGVHWVPQVGRYLITSYEAVHEVELDQETFSANEEGSLMIRAMGHSMLRRDDPEHYVERKAWQPVLRPGAVKHTWAPIFQRNAEKFLDEFAAKGPGADLIWDFAAPFAGENLREMIGLHNVTHHDLQRWSKDMIDATGNYADDAEVWARGKRAFDEVDAALDEMLQWHAKHQDHSLISTLLRLPDYQMPLDRIRANVKMTIGGGLNEPRDAIGVGVWALLTHPRQRAMVERDPSLWNAAFDETIRWVAPIGLYSRQTTTDTVLAGVKLPAKAKLGICILSANRDAKVWSNAEAFDIRREVQPHLAFGKGVHVCLGAPAARSAVADVALPLVFSSLKGLALSERDPAEIAGWVFRGMTKLPVTWQSYERRSAPLAAVQMTPPTVAIVGSGPAGCFTAQSLKRTFADARVDVFDEQPTPYGLVRYGVAPDHQGTKTVARQFDRLFLEQGVGFVGNCRVGADVSLAELREHYDVVVVATGMHQDVPVSVPGANLRGVRGAGQVTRFLNAHPDEPTPAPLGDTVVVVGQGNVAMDVVRLLTRDTAGFAGSDIDDEAYTHLAGAVRTIHVVGRSLPGEAKFDPVMVRELASLPGVRHVVHGDIDFSQADKHARLDAVRALTNVSAGAGAGAGDGDGAGAGARERVRVEWWFGLTPVRFESEVRRDGERDGQRDGERDGQVSAVVFAEHDGSEVRLDATDVITAVGFTADEGSLVEPAAHPDGRVEPGLYVAGWLRRGPRGTIPDQRADARDLARTIAADVQSGLVVPRRSGLAAPANSVNFEGWRRIDVRERLGAAPGRERAKLRTRADLLRAAADTQLELPAAAIHSAHSGFGAVPTTVLFGTESGGAELVAEELRSLFDADADLQVSDLDDISPDELDPERLHLIVCSTYGDGEVPSSAQRFYRALTEGTPQLDGVRYAMFGMGDRSYEKTYSRGSELLDEALAARGAVRVGEFGRHDAGGPVPATEAAEQWASGVLTEMAAATVLP